jgi:hypothetical protein
VQAATSSDPFSCLLSELLTDLSRFHGIARNYVPNLFHLVKQACSTSDISSSHDECIERILGILGNKQEGIHSKTRTTDNISK